MTTTTSTPTPAPDDPVGRERERDRLLTLANVQRMRGQNAEARETLKNALLLSDAESPAASPTHELIGDSYATDEKWEDARAAYDKARLLDPQRASAERKFAQVTLKIADLKAEKALAEAVLRGEAPPSAAGFGGLDPLQGRRKPGIALLFSSIAPGFGQFYNGQIFKGALFLGLFVVFVVLANVLPGGDVLKEQIVYFISGASRRARGEISAGALFAFVMATILWVCAVIDAPMVAAKTGGGGKNDPNLPRPPSGDRSGWEV